MKRSPIVYVFIAFALLVGCGVVLVAVASWYGSRVPARTVLHLALHGEVPEVPGGSDLLFGEPKGLTMGQIQRALRVAADDDAVIGLVIDVHDPDIGLAQLQELEAAAAELRQAGKWTLGFLETAGELSPGTVAYAAAAMADRIVLAPSGDINLPAPRAEVPFLRRAADKLEISVHTQQRYRYKSAAETFSEEKMTPGALESTKALVDDLTDQVATYLAMRRKVDKTAVLGWMQSTPHLAEQARERGLVDALGYWDAVLAEVAAQVLPGGPTPPTTAAVAPPGAPAALGVGPGVPPPVDGAAAAPAVPPAPQTAAAPPAATPPTQEELLLDLSEYAKRRLRDPGGTHLALVIAQGAITRGESAGALGSGTVGSDTLTAALRQAREAGVKGVLLRIDSPGGSYIASDLIRREVEVTRAAGIPVVVSMGSVAASGGYFIAMHADRIVALPGTLTGSIGVYAGRFGLRRFFADFLGLTWDGYEAVPGGDFYSMLDAPDAQSTQRLSESLDRIYQDFVSKAAAGRGKTYEQIHAVAQGRVWTGEEALTLGLVDELGGYDVALRRLRRLCGLEEDADVSVELFPKPKSTLERLLELTATGVRVGTRVGGATLGLQRLAERGDALLAPELVLRY